MGKFPKQISAQQKGLKKIVRYQLWGNIEQELSLIIIMIFDDEENYCTTSYCSPRKYHAQSKGEKKKHFYALEITQPLTCQNNNGPFLKKGSRVDGE